MKHKHLILFSIFLTYSSGAQETYTVKKNEVLSQIVLKNVPSYSVPLYGPKGRLQEILELNPKLKNNPNKIYPNQVIILNKSPVATEIEDQTALEVTPEMTIEPEIENAPSPVVADVSENKISHWDLSAHYGIKAVSYNQRSTLGTSDVSAMFPSYYQLTAEYTQGNWAGWLSHNSFKLNYEAGQYEESVNIKSYEVGASYKKFLASVSLDETPLFRETATRIDMAKYSFLNVGIGWRDQWNYKSSIFAFKSWLKYPVSADSEKSQVKISSPTGVKLKGQLQWQYPIYQTSQYQLFADWQNDISYQQSKLDVKWDTQSGKVDTMITEYSTSIGLHLKF